MKCNLKNLKLLQDLSSSNSILCSKYENLESVTIVIPSFNRQSYLLRQIAYWASSKATVIIVDQSKKILSDDILRHLESFPNINYLYLNNDLFARLNAASKMIFTKYALLLGDDEFILQSGLSKAINHLDHNDIASCIGQSLWFDMKGKGIDPLYREGYQHSGYSIKQEAYHERLNFMLSDYRAATCYAVMKSEAWIAAYANLNFYSCLPVAELQMAIITVAFGKLDTIKDIYWLRSAEQPTVYVKGKWETRKVSFISWWTEGNYKHEVDIFINLTAIRVQEITGDALDVVRDNLISALNAYAHSEQLKKISSAPVFLKARHLLGKIWPIFLTKKMIFKIQKLLKVNNEINLEKLLILNEFENDKYKISPDASKDLAYIDRIITEFSAINR